MTAGQLHTPRPPKDFRSPPSDERNCPLLSTSISCGILSPHLDLDIRVDKGVFVRDYVRVGADQPVANFHML